jgi:hypothetical protein
MRVTGSDAVLSKEQIDSLRGPGSQLLKYAARDNMEFDNYDDYKESPAFDNWGNSPPSVK